MALPLSTWNTTSGMASAASAGATESNITLNFCRRMWIEYLKCVVFVKNPWCFNKSNLFISKKQNKRLSEKTVEKKWLLSGKFWDCETSWLSFFWSGWVVCFWFCCIYVMNISKKCSCFSSFFCVLGMLFSQFFRSYSIFLDPNVWYFRNLLCWICWAFTFIHHAHRMRTYRHVLCAMYISNMMYILCIICIWYESIRTML